MRRPTKYRNQPVVVDGVRFASKAEAARDAELRLLVKAGKITDLKRQPRFKLEVNGQKVCTYVGDWQYDEITQQPWRYTGAGQPFDGMATTRHTVVEDRKGVLTPAFKIKWALAKALHPEIEWRLS